MRKTIFVLGAGASKEVSLPIGQKLKSHISDLLDIGYSNFGRQESGDPLISCALQSHVEKSSQPQRELQLYIHAARRVRDGMPLAPSIDNFIDAHRGDQYVEMCGKLAIVRAILEAERGSALYTDPRRPDDRLDQSALTSTWFNSFWQIFCEGCTAHDLEQRAQTVEFVVFNYDRCLERFLHCAMQSYYGIKADDAARVVAKINVFHPYGSIGTLPGFNGSATVHYGGEVHASRLVELAKGIKTFTESTDSNEISAIRNAVNNAARVVFLGFAFHPINLKLLWPDKQGRRPASANFYGTAHGISQSDTGIISSELADLAGLDPNWVTLNRDVLCYSIFHEYKRSLAFA